MNPSRRTTLLHLVFCTMLVGCVLDSEQAATPPGPTVVGEEIQEGASSPAYTALAESSALDLVWQHELHFEGATYIAPHFSRFSLPEGAYLVVRTPDSRRSRTYAGRGHARPGTEGFWALHMPGDRAVIELYSTTTLAAGAVHIDVFARGLDAWRQKAAPKAYSEDSEDIGTEAICSEDDSLEARCYQTSEPEAYDKARAVARLMINGTSACTGWLVGSEGHVMTNEHCIGDASDAANTSFEFMAEGADCDTSCKSWGACSGTVEAESSTLIKVNANLDYALVKLPTNPSATHGYLQLRDSGAVLGERIYIPQHPAAWGKRIALKDGAEDAVVTSLTAAACSGGSDYNDVGYQADTQGGSSGSPVVSYDDHLVVALHHCANCPNRGVPIDLIVEDLGEDTPADAVAGGCTPAVSADAGPNQTICLGDAVTIGTAAREGHTYSWTLGGASAAQIDVSPASTTTYTVTASTVCGTRTDSVTVYVDDGTGSGFSDDFEGDVSGWTLDGLWHLTDDSSCATPGSASATHAMYYGQDESCDYDTGAATTGSLTSPVITGINTNSTLSFQYLRQVESYSGAYDKTVVEVSASGAGWTEVWALDSSTASENAWTSSGDISLAEFAGQSIQVRFVFDSRDSASNTFVGWLIDDVVVEGESSCGGAGNTAPAAAISSPADGATFTEGEPVALAGSASDSEDGDLSAALSWTSSLDGALGTGASLEAVLSVGTHTITAEVTDSGGLSGAAAITVEVAAAPSGFVEDFEGDVSGWTTSGLWHVTDSSSCAAPGYASATHAMYYGQDESCDYDTGVSTSGELVSPVISGVTADTSLRFQYFRQVESYSGDYDRTEVDVSADGGATWTEVWSRTSADASENAWTASGDIALGSYAGQDIQLRFRFASRDSVSNGFTGWLLDDVVVQ